MNEPKKAIAERDLRGYLVQCKLVASESSPLVKHLDSWDPTQ